MCASAPAPLGQRCTNALARRVGASPSSDRGSASTFANFLFDGLEQIFNFVALAVKDEDYPVIESAQKSLEPGLLTRVQLGRNEVALQDFHRHLLEDTGSPG